MISVPTQFNLLIDTPISLISVKAHNALTGKSALLPKEKKQGNSPRHSNHPVFKSPSQAIEVWSSEVEIKKVRVIEHPIKIMPGVKIYMHPNASLIFRNRVLIEGTKLAPVSILPLNSGQTWGAVALHGIQTEGSIINHLNIKDGSGAIIDNVRYIGSLSIHEAQNIEFNHLHIIKNHSFDDMMHIIYFNLLSNIGKK